MNSSSLHLPEYGDSGDLIGARRMRRAFRWGVTLAVAFTVLLWVTEEFWRYPPADRLYRSALTLLPEQGRNLLRQSVKYDAQSQIPSSKYYEALAEREEEDLVIAAYENANKLDPQNPDLSIKFGCQLFKLGLTSRAREQFRQAAEGGTHNALAVYLEASVLPLLDPDEPNIDVALSLVKQANATGDRVSFPRPMWFPALPREGYQYAQLRRQMVRLCGAPIEKFAELVLESSEKSLLKTKSADSLPGLELLQTMGRRIAAGAADPAMSPVDLAGGAPQVYLGLRTMSLAIEQQKRVAQLTSGAPDINAVSLGAKIGPSLQAIEDFERKLQETAQAEREKYGFPWILFETTLTITLVCFVTAYCAGKILRVQGPAHSVRHSTLARTMWGIYFGSQAGLLMLVTVLQRTSHGAMPGQTLLAALWHTLLVVSLLVSIAAPALSLCSPVEVLQRLSPDQRGEIGQIRKRYRMAYVSLVKRYLGVQLGLTLCVLCIWIITYRIFVATYPWMWSLLVTGMETEEIDLIRNIVATLG